MTPEAKALALALTDPWKMIYIPAAHEQEIVEQPGFVSATQYVGVRPHPGEIGCVGRTRYVCVP